MTTTTTDGGIIPGHMYTVALLLVPGPDDTIVQEQRIVYAENYVEETREDGSVRIRTAVIDGLPAFATREEGEAAIVAGGGIVDLGIWDD